MNLKVKDINALLGITVTGKPLDKEGVPCKSLGCGDYRINIIGHKNLQKFEKAVEAILKEDIEIKNGYTFESLANRLLALLQEKKINQKEFELAELKDFVNELKNTPNHNYTVLRDIVGISMKESAPPLEIGPFTIYDFRQHRGIIEQNKSALAALKWFQGDHDFLIQYQVSAKEQAKALEVADDKFEQFVIFLWFLIGYPTDRYEIGILSYQGYRNREAYVFSDKEVGHSAQGYGSFEPIPLGTSYFLDPTYGLDFFWQLIDKNDQNELERRIISAVRWIGQSIMDRYIQSAFVKAAISIEVLLGPKRSEKCESIAKFIANRLNLVLHYDDSGLDITGIFETLYEIRSAIAHAGKQNVKQSDYFDLLWIARQTVFKLISDPLLRSCHSIESAIAELEMLIPGTPDLQIG